MSARRSSRGPVNPALNPNTERSSVGQLRITPRNSDGDESIAAAAVKETPWRTLNQLANIPRPTTPLRRASSAGPPSTRRSSRRTPSGQARTPGTQRIGGSAKRTIAITPHGRAAQRELDQRRAGFTPGKDRRRSGRQQRETPSGILRALSRQLAPKSLPIVPTPQGPNASTRRNVQGEDDFDDEPDPERPRLSLPMGDEDDDDSFLVPPRSAGLEDENFTIQSVELPRRAVSELPPGRLSRGSFGSVRMSDVFADLNDPGLMGDGYDSSYLAGGRFGDDEISGMADVAAVQGENTGTLRGRISLASGRDSDIRPGTLPADDTETTFVLTVPQRDPSEEPELEDPLELPDLDNDEGILEEDEVEELEETDDEELQPQSSTKEPYGDISMQDTTPQDVAIVDAQQRKVIRKKKLKVSKHGIQYPSLPAGVVKKLATTFARTAGNSKAKINKEALEAIMQASDWFFEQVSDDLGAYAKHAGRKTIDESDIVTLMARQRQTNATTTPFSLAQRHLPRELLQELRMVPPSKFKKGRQLERVEEAEED